MSSTEPPPHRGASERPTAAASLGERWLKALTEHGADVITLHAADGRIVYAAPSVTHILGYQVDETLGRQLREWLHPDDQEGFAQAFEALCGTSAAARTQRFRLRHKAGAWRWMEATGINLLDDPNVRAVVINQHDITPQRDAEEALRQSEQRFRALVENSEDGIELATARGTILYVSPSTARLFGRSGDEIVGRNVFELIDPEERERLSELWRRSLDTPGVPVRGEFRHVQPTGAERFIETVRVNRLDDPGLRAIVTIYRDVSRRRELEDQVRQSQKMEAVGRLAGGIAHDFNNILSAIHGFASIVRGQLPDRDTLREDMDEILTAVDRAAALTRQLLAFSRKQVLQPRPLDIARYVRDLEGMLRRVIGEHIDLILRLEDEVTPAKADPGQLEQVILNLVVNARDAMPTGGRLVIEARAAVLDEDYAASHPEVTPGLYACLVVTDTGAGMARDVQERVFEPFFTTKHTGQGTGLGLATVFGIVKQSGGHISVYSEPGLGTTFRVYFPTTEERPAAEVARPKPTRAPCGTETILLVEDEDAVRSFLSRILRREGYQLLEAANGGEALLLAEQHPGVIHLLLTDVVMPRLSGRQLAERLLKLRDDMRVLYMSGYAEEAIVAQGILSPGAAFIEKPLTAESLGRKVRDILDRTPAPLTSPGTPPPPSNDLA